MANSTIIAYYGKKILNTMPTNNSEITGSARTRQLMSTNETHCDHQSPKTKRIIKVMNFYNFSPMFLLFGGLCTRKKLVKKLHIREDSSLCNYLMNLYTFLFCDELVIILTIITTIMLLNKYWVEPKKTIAFYEGYHEYKNLQDALYISCYMKPTPVCFFCDQIVRSSVIDDNATYTLVNNDKGCDKTPPIHCKQIQNTSVDLVKSHAATKKSDFTDYRVYDDVYFMYNSYHKRGNINWRIIACDKAAQANSKVSEETQTYNLYLALIGLSLILFYLIILVVTSCLYNRINVDEHHEINLLF